MRAILPKSLPCLPLLSHSPCISWKTGKAHFWLVHWVGGMCLWRGQAIPLPEDCLCVFTSISSVGIKMAFCEEEELHRLLKFINRFWRREFKCAFEFSVVWNTFENSRQKFNRQLHSILWSWKHSTLSTAGKMHPPELAIICFLDRHRHTSHGTCFYHITAPKCLSQSGGIYAYSYEVQGHGLTQGSSRSIVF